MLMDPILLICLLIFEVGFPLGYYFGWLLDESDLDAFERHRIEVYR